MHARSQLVTVLRIKLLDRIEDSRKLFTERRQFIFNTRRDFGVSTYAREEL